MGLLPEKKWKKSVFFLFKFEFYAKNKGDIFFGPFGHQEGQKSRFVKYPNQNLMFVLNNINSEYSQRKSIYIIKIILINLLIDDGMLKFILFRERHVVFYVSSNYVLNISLYF